MRKKTKRSNLILAIAAGLVLFLCVLAFLAARWYINVFGDVGFDSILSTLTAGVGGAGRDLIGAFLLDALLPAVILVFVLEGILFAVPKRALVARILDRIRIRLYPLPRVLSAVLSLVLAAAFLWSAAITSGLTAYIEAVRQRSTVFEKKYVDPSDVSIVFPEQKQNLIYIYLESMEITFMSEAQGGGNDVNAIPELYELARDNINFSHNDAVGGYTALSGASWTIAAMVAQTSGIPLKVPLGVDGNDYGQNSFLPGVTSLSDILHDAGYYQALMVGSDASFGGRKQYYEQHGTDKVYDYFTAKEDGLIPEDYYVWWGMEDAKLFEYAKRELTEISSSDQPFAFSLLTVDTHHIAGYLCEFCGLDYAEQYENVLACSSRQVLEFVNWIREQDFYENTTVVIYGDHPTMDAEYIMSNIPDGYQRKVYNCIINSRVDTDYSKNREFCTVDLFPTTLAAMGCTIEGDRLGLGTNLFSGQKTLCEIFGIEEFNGELIKNSHYYETHFYD